ncbi:hypothetical protein [Stenotrophomonas sp. MMGLT7]|uniref:hypothetical protein n=1 Tax=Stenotrophomonas sp. MMGLT7 TaxID=2901227 RepID=UPI001E620D69|nr:hypothetical protein [Stenotrophomonas sp. MMGLT7]
MNAIQSPPPDDPHHRPGRAPGRGEPAECEVETRSPARQAGAIAVAQVENGPWSRRRAVAGMAGTPYPFDAAPLRRAPFPSPSPKANASTLTDAARPIQIQGVP